MVGQVSFSSDYLDLCVAELVWNLRNGDRARPELFRFKVQVREEAKGKSFELVSCSPLSNPDDPLIKRLLRRPEDWPGINSLRILHEAHECKMGQLEIRDGVIFVPVVLGKIA